MAGIVILFLMSAALVHACGLSAITESGRPTTKRVWVVFFVIAFFVLPLLVGIAMLWLGGMANGVYSFFFIAGGFTGAITMLIHGAIKVSAYNTKYGPP